MTRLKCACVSGELSGQGLPRDCACAWLCHVSMPVSSWFSQGLVLLVIVATRSTSNEINSHEINSLKSTPSNQLPTRSTPTRSTPSNQLPTRSTPTRSTMCSHITLWRGISPRWSCSLFNKRRCMLKEIEGWRYYLKDFRMESVA